ncbi:TIGR01244 family sulfur transferase [Neisseria polysaccharea]|uniref:TIGR01244 family sulfur transferase n=1 Tax=Neisseria polysaccharea TaxID=489 RepID=UPI0027E0A1A8|nr:TIGR01244 family sulfur transferase [Neisseria polysaccharea]
MAILKLDEHLYISPQLTKADAEQISLLGIKTVICNRPDCEEESQPDFAQIKQWLEQAGVTGFHHQPVIARDIQNHDVEAFRQLIGQAEYPVLAYCRTGTRCSLLWGLRRAAEGMPVDEIIRRAEAAGVNLENFRTRLEDAAVKP